MSELVELLQQPLSEEDIELRVGSSDKYNGKWITLLLYKTARVDRDRLTEVLGLHWTNEHYVDAKGNVICKIGVWDEYAKHWVYREDTGSESFTEKEKGSYSDAFKRAGFRWGIGTELYKAPTIFINWDNWTQKNGSYYVKGSFKDWKVEFHDKDAGLLGGFNILDKFGTVKFSTKGSKKSAPKKAAKKTSASPKKYDKKVDEQEKKNEENIAYTKSQVNKNLKELSQLDSEFDVKSFVTEKRIAKAFNPDISQLREIQEILQLKINKIKKEK